MAYNIEQRDEQLIGSYAAITYTLEFDRAPQHIVRVRMTISNVNSEEITLVMPSWSPGSYKIRDYVGYQGNVVVHSDAKPLAFRWTGVNKLTVVTAGMTEVFVDYVIFGNERSVRTNHINRFHAFIQPPATFMYVEGRTQEIHHVLLKNDRKLWPNASTQLSPVRESSAQETLLGALNYDVLADSPIEIGSHVVKTFTLEGATHEVALASSQPLDADWITEQLKVIVKTEASIFGGVPYDRYVFIIQAYLGARGGLEHSRSSVNAIDPTSFLDKSKASALLSLLCHEYFHLWNVKRIRPVELGPFDYVNATQTPMLWLAEGLTSYYDDLIAYRCGFLTLKEYLATLAKDHLDKLLRVPGRHAMSVRDSSRLAWVKLYMQSPDAPNRFPSYYLKGGLVFLLIDLYIIDNTAGSKSLDDGMRLLWARYQNNPSVGVTEDECIALFERAVGVDLRDKMMSWLDESTDLPFEELFSLAGIELTLGERVSEAITFGENRSFTALQPELFCGWVVSGADGRVFIRGVEDGSPAEKAGLGIDDEIIAVSGRRVTTTEQLSRAIDDAGLSEIHLICECDGITFETTIRPGTALVHTLNVAEETSKKQRLVREIWLKRNV
ncbi:MAG: PDZ domain-containing protein [Ignavibacteria bacterium]|nr:PDZ domain-containing protein [Ignavibacteria bacterium]